MPHLLRFMPAVPNLRLTGIVDILVVAFLVYEALMVVRGTRAGHILIGILVMVLLYAVALWAGLEALRAVLSFIVPYLGLAIIVLFQSEIRRTLARIGRKRWLGAGFHAPESANEILLAVEELAQRSIGALIVLERDIGLRTFIESGVPLEALLSRDLLLSIFQPGVPLHDGAVIVQKGRIAAAACFLPLTTNPALSRTFGTRHRAAIGITEETDCLSIVISEESGLHFRGLVRRVDPGAFRGPGGGAHQPAFRRAAAGAGNQPRAWRRPAGREGGPAMKQTLQRALQWTLRLVFHNFGWKLLALAIAVVLWALVASEPELSEFATVRLEYRNLPDDLEISSDPVSSVSLELRGPSGELRGAGDGIQPAVVLDMSDVQPGERTFTIGASNVKLARGVRLVRSIPSEVRFHFERRVVRFVPVVVRITGQGQNGYTVAHQSVTPDRLEIAGPSSRVARITAAVTDPVDLSSVVGTSEFRVNAFVDDSFVRFQSSPQVVVTVTMKKKR